MKPRSSPGNLRMLNFPPADHPIGGAPAYHVRTGGHDILACDWARCLDFVGRPLRSTSANTSRP